MREEEIHSILEKDFGIRHQKLSHNTDLIKDLGIGGYDGHILMQTICKKYDIECTDFDWVDVFGPEGLYGPFVLNPITWYKWLFKKEELLHPKFTIGMLIDAAKKKKIASYKPNGYYFAKEIIIG